MVLLSLVLMTLAVARLTRLVKGDQITIGLRRWVVNKFGEESRMAYLVHCSWCTSMWLALPAGIAWAFPMLPMRQWWLALPAALAMSYVVGLLSQIEES
jgi:hypothetical protein